MVVSDQGKSRGKSDIIIITTQSLLSTSSFEVSTSVRIEDFYLLGYNAV
jgi:hypothetical protein